MLTLLMTLVIGAYFPGAKKALVDCGTDFFGTSRCGKYLLDTGVPEGPDIGAIEYVVASTTTSQTDTRTVNWDGSHYTHDHFVVYWGPEPDVYDNESAILKTTNFQIDDSRGTIYVVVQAFDSHDRPSEFSNEVKLEKGIHGPTNLRFKS